MNIGANKDNGRIFARIYISSQVGDTKVRQSVTYIEGKGEVRKEIGTAKGAGPLVNTAAYVLVENSKEPAKKEEKQKKEDKNPQEKQAKAKEPQKANTWEHLDIAEIGFVHVPKGKGIATKEAFAGPIEITVVARMEGTDANAYDIRLAAFAGGMVCYNRADHPDKLYVHRPDGDDIGKGLTSETTPFKPVASNTWATFKWRIDNQGMTVTVDDNVVYSEKGRKYNFAAAKHRFRSSPLGRLLT